LEYKWEITWEMLRFKKKFYNGFHDDSSILDADIKELCIHVIKKLIERTQNDETKSINKNAVYEEACDSSSGIGAFDSTNITLKNTVFEELFTREHISQGNNLMKSKLQT
jgi:hypothetical protein